MKRTSIPFRLIVQIIAFGRVSRLFIHRGTGYVGAVDKKTDVHSCSRLTSDTSFQRIDIFRQFF
jgi:hypothetical protein